MTQPHAAYATWPFKQMVLPNTYHKECFQPFGIIPALLFKWWVEKPISPTSKTWGLTNPTTQADAEFSASLKVTDLLKYAIQLRICRRCGKQADGSQGWCPQTMGKQSVKQKLCLTEDRGAPEFGIMLHKSAFQDALTLRQLPRVPSSGVKFSIEHAPSCSKGGASPRFNIMKYEKHNF